MEKRKRRTKILCWSAAAVAGLIVAAALATKYWIAPALLRHRLQTLSSRYFAGEIHIRRVDFRDFNTVHLRNVRLLDRDNQEHVSVDTVTLVLRDLIRARPIVTDVMVEGLKLRIHRTGSRFVFPFRIPDDSGIQQHLDLESLSVRNASLAFHKDGEVTHRYAPIALRITREAESYGVRLEFAGLTDTSIVASGKLDVISEEEVRLSGRIDAGEQPLAQEIDLTITHRNRDGRSIEAKLSSLALNGTIDGSLTIDAGRDRALRYTGVIRTERLQLHSLPQRPATPRPPRTAVLTAELRFTGSGTDLRNLRGRGLVVLENVNARGDPITREIFALLNDPIGHNSTLSSIEAVFSLRGEVVTLQEAILADALSVMKVEPGGTINLLNRKLDLRIITLQLRGLSKVLNHVPMMNLAASLSNKLTTIHVTGTWDDKKLSQEPVTDISAAALEFLQEAIVLGGRLGPEAHSAFSELFNSLSNSPNEDSVGGMQRAAK